MSSVASVDMFQPAPSGGTSSAPPPRAAPGERGVSIDFDAINAPLGEEIDDPSDREMQARNQVEAIQVEVAQRLEEFRKMVARFGRNHDYILHQPDGSTRSCHSRDLEDLSGRGVVQPADFIRNVTTGETHLAIDIPWLRAILVARRHASFGSQSKYLRRVRRRRLYKVSAVNLLVLGILAAEIVWTDTNVLQLAQHLLTGTGWLG